MRSLTLLLPALVCTLSAQTPSDLPQRLAAHRGLKAPALQQLRAELAGFETSSPWKAYQESYLSYLIVAMASDAEAKGAEALLDRSLKALETRQDAESLALQGAFIGLKLRYAPMSGMTLAPKAMGLFEAAQKLEPKNPRVLLLKGVHTLHTPSFFGGGPLKAMPLFQEALAAAEVETPATDPLAPRWGKPEVHVWMASAELRQGHRDLAKAQLEQALALDPAYGHARSLMAQLSKDGRP